MKNISRDLACIGLGGFITAFTIKQIYMYATTGSTLFLLISGFATWLTIVLAGIYGRLGHF